MAVRFPLPYTQYNFELGTAASRLLRASEVKFVFVMVVKKMNWQKFEQRCENKLCVKLGV
jgi:hypothetical protein